MIRQITAYYTKSIFLFSFYASPIFLQAVNEPNVQK